MKRSVVVVAGGSGTRMGTGIPKQFLVLGSQPVLMHTLEIFHRFDSQMQIILVLPESQVEYWKKLCSDHRFSLPHCIVFGGKTRFQSVRNGLEQVNDADLIGVHDGVRPFVSQETLMRCFEAAALYGNAIPVVSVHETLRQLKGENSVTVDRNMFRLVQTPQVFERNSFLHAYQVDESPAFTDDASVFENAGHSIHLVEGNRENIKITEPIDLWLGNAFLHRQVTE